MLLAERKDSGSLAVRKQLLREKLTIRTLKKIRFLTKIKLRPPIETVWSLKLPGLNAYALREEQNGRSLASAKKRREKILSRP